MVVRLGNGHIRGIDLPDKGFEYSVFGFNNPKF